MKNTSLDIISLRDTARPAGMPMYVMPEIENMLNRWWQGLGRHLREAGVKRVPDRLERPDNLTIHWLNKDLLFSQTCGFPLTHILDNNVTLVAVPVYNVPGCEGIMYCSMIIVRNDLQASSLADLRNSNVAINGWDSQSGFNALRTRLLNFATPGEKFFSRTIVTTSHAESIASVRNGEAQCAAIDNVTFALFQKYRPLALEGIRVLDQTDSVPGLPYITRKTVSSQELNALRAGLFSALTDPELANERSSIMLNGAAIVDRDEYNIILEMEQRSKSIKF